MLGSGGRGVCVCVCVFGLVEIKRYFFVGGTNEAEAKEFSNSKSKTLQFARRKVPSPPRTFLATQFESADQTSSDPVVAIFGHTLQ